MVFCPETIASKGTVASLRVCVFIIELYPILRYRTTSLLLLRNYLLYFGGSGRGRPAEQGFALMYLLESRLALKIGSSFGVNCHQKIKPT